MKKILFISTSLRNGSNSQILAKEAFKGAKDKGHEVEFISLKDKKINFCTGCYACYKMGECILKDDVAKIIESITKADTIVFATPIYYYEMSGQMKTLLDRLLPIHKIGYNFKEVLMIATAADDDSNVFNKAYDSLNAWVNCFDDVILKDILVAKDIDKTNDILNNQDKLLEAYNFGYNL